MNKMRPPDSLLQNPPSPNVSLKATIAALSRQARRPDEQVSLLSLPRGPVKPLKRNLICAHGSPWGEDEYISSEFGAEAALASCRDRIVLFGHTHDQGAWISNGRALYPLEPDFKSREGVVDFELSLRRRNNRYLLNPGSVGQPRDWRAAFAIYDDARLRFTWYRVPYQVLTAQSSIQRAGLPEALATRLREGR